MRLIPVLAVVPVVLLVGCTPQSPEPAPTVTVTAPAPEPPESPAAERSSATKLDGWDAYLSCRNLTIMYFGGTDGNDPGLVDYASFEDSYVHPRPDGNFFVYIEVHNGNAEEGSADASAAECIVGGGTLGGFEYHQFGSTIRLSEAEITALQDEPLSTGP